jgi:ABC-type glutathione transport system ATPase component
MSDSEACGALARSLPLSNSTQPEETLQKLSTNHDYPDKERYETPTAARGTAETTKRGDTDVMSIQDDRLTPAVPVIEIENMDKAYKMGETEVHALRDVSLTIQEGEYVAIIGASGSGKSTLMNMIGLLDRPTSGSYRIRGRETSTLGESAMADLRNDEIGFVFQRLHGAHFCPPPGGAVALLCGGHQWRSQ